MATTNNKTRKKKIEPFEPHWALRERPVSQQYLEDIANRMIAWSELPDSFILTKFMLTLPHAPFQIYEWAKEHQCILIALDIARGNIAVRREERAAASNPDYYKIYERNQAVYDMPYRDVIKWREDIKPKSASSADIAKDLTVLMTTFPSSPAVPDREKDRE